MSEQTDYRTLQILNFIAVLATVIFNLLVNVIPLNGVTTGEVADSYPNLFTPPGYVFAIWAVIYILLVTFAVYQVRTEQRSASYLKDISYLYVLNAISNISWLVIFHYSFGNPGLFLWSVIPIVLLLVILLLTYVRLDIGVKKVPLREKLAVHLPISVYAGWISLATIANIASALNVLVPGIPTATQELWTVIVIVIALVITLLMLWLRRDMGFSLVVIWASTGIAVKQAARVLIFGAAAGAAIIVVVAILLIPFIKKESLLSYYKHSSD